MLSIMFAMIELGVSVKADSAMGISSTLRERADGRSVL